MKKVALQIGNFNEVAEEAAGFLKRGHAIVFPTDTLYALGVDAMNPDAIDRFFSIKKRPSNKPVPVFVRDIEMAKKLAFIDKRQEKIIEKAWPGPFTFVFYKRKEVSKKLTSGTQKIGLRIPDNDFCMSLLDFCDGPVTSSSANISGEEPATDINAIIKQFRDNSITPEYVIENKIDAEKNTNPSAVVDITEKEPKILRMNQTTIRKMSELFGL